VSEETTSWNSVADGLPISAEELAARGPIAQCKVCFLLNEKIMLFGMFSICRDMLDSGEEYFLYDWSQYLTGGPEQDDGYMIVENMDSSSPVKVTHWIRIPEPPGPITTSTEQA
jgi:hypothetical protein